MMWCARSWIHLPAGPYPPGPGISAPLPRLSLVVVLDLPPDDRQCSTTDQAAGRRPGEPTAGAHIRRVDPPMRDQAGEPRDDRRRRGTEGRELEVLLALVLLAELEGNLVELVEERGHEGSAHRTPPMMISGSSIGAAGRG